MTAVTGSIRRVLAWTALLGVVALLLFSLWWRVEGGRWMRVETPSMGTRAPVGTLLWVRPAPFDTLQPGDFITFHPPGRPDLTYSHLVHARNADGTLTTKGVIPAVDPWRIGPSDVIGTVRMQWWGAGWLVAAGPMLLAGGCLVMAVRAVVSKRWKAPVALVLGSVVLVATVLWWRPLLGADRLAVAPDASGGVTVTYVGTGLLPVRVSAEGGGTVVLSDGEVGSVETAPGSADRLNLIRLGPAITWWWWVLLVAVCFVPALARLVTGGRRASPAAEVGSRPPCHRRVLESHRVPSHHRRVGAAG
jgi:hypothetical protein